MTQLYLIRHGIAADRSEYASDKARPLTEAGQQKTTKIAQRLRQLDLKFEALLSSPLLRARQTAEILQNAQLCDKVETFPALAPAGNLHDWLTWWRNGNFSPKAKLAVVGHQPDLGDWAQMLVWGSSQEKLIVKKAGVIGVALPEVGDPVGRSELFWLTPPRFLL